MTSATPRFGDKQAFMHLGPLAFGGMPEDEAREGFELFAAEVLPELRRHDVGGDIGVAYDAAPANVA